jgi:hypothetical protein
VVFTVDATDTGHGAGLTPAVAAAVPELVAAMLGELREQNSADAAVDFRRLDEDLGPFERPLVEVRMAR